ncbi:MAG: glycine cleavage system protein GcvH [Candidatus Omnitrophota bacterium]
MDLMDNYLYTKEHEWANLEDEDLVVVGLTEYAQSSMGDVTYIELPEAGTEVEQFEQLASLESVKAASDVYSPLSGEIVEVNTALESNPELINKSCYELGWILKLRPSAPEEKGKLMNSEEYEKYVENLD